MYSRCKWSATDRFYRTWTVQLFGHSSRGAYLSELIKPWKESTFNQPNKLKRCCPAGQWRRVPCAGHTATHCRSGHTSPFSLLAVGYQCRVRAMVVYERTCGLRAGPSPSPTGSSVRRLKKSLPALRPLGRRCRLRPRPYDERRGELLRLLAGAPTRRCRAPAMDWSTGRRRGRLIFSVPSDTSRLTPDRRGMRFMFSRKSDPIGPSATWRPGRVR